MRQKLGILAAVLLVVGPLSLPIWITEFEVWRGVRDNQLETRPVPGDDPTRFDPLAGVAVARELAGDGATLMAIRMELLRRDGTMDLTANLTPRPKTTYEFVRPAARPPATVPPVGAGGSLSGAWSERVTVTALRPNTTPALIWGGANGLNRWSPYSRAREIINKGLVREVNRPTPEQARQTLPPPTCPLPLLWQAAIARGAPPDALAEINYTAAGYGFDIRGTSLSFLFGLDCQLRR